MSEPATRSFQTILISREASTLTITLNRPERRNAIGSQMTNELLYAIRDAHEDATVRAIVITGAGKVFCAGGDFAQMTAGGAVEQLPVIGGFPELLLALTRATKPVIARVNGHATGGGLGIVAACTFAVASNEAELGTPEINVGLFPMMIMAILIKIVPRRRLLEMMLLGERMKAAEAVSIGLLNRAVPLDELDAAVSTIATAIASKSPVIVRLGLEAFVEQEDLSFGDALPMLEGRLAACLATDDAREGLTAFLEKRKPNWTGK